MGTTSLGEHPGQCQLCRRNAFFAGQLLDRCSQLEVFLQRLLSETGIRPPPIAWVEIIEFLDCTCQESAPERTVRDEVMPSSRQVVNTPLLSTSRDQSEYSLCNAAIGWIFAARRSVSGPASDSPSIRTLPAETSSAIAPTGSSIGTSGSTRC